MAVRVPRPVAHRRILEMVQVEMVLLGIRLKRLRQIQHRKSVAGTECRDPAVGIEEVRDTAPPSERPHGRTAFRQKRE